jgi:hypothetical protein
VRPNGKPRYACRFVASDELRDQALAACPQLEGTIKVVGDLQTDRLLARCAQRDAIRSRMGFEQQDRVALILSSWGPDSVLEQMGEQLVEKIVSQGDHAQGGFRFIFSTHPNHWRGAHSEKHPLGEYLMQHLPDHVYVVQPDEDTLDAIVAADVALTDHGSMATNIAMLGKPLGVVAVNPKTLAPGSISEQFQQLLPRFQVGDSLSQFLEALPDQCPIEEMKSIVEKFVSYPGEAKQRIRTEIYKLLKLK